MLLCTLDTPQAGQNEKRRYSSSCKVKQEPARFIMQAVRGGKEAPGRPDPNPGSACPGYYCIIIDNNSNVHHESGSRAHATGPVATIAASETSKEETKTRLNPWGQFMQCNIHA